MYMCSLNRHGLFFCLFLVTHNLAHTSSYDFDYIIWYNLNSMCWKGQKPSTTFFKTQNELAWFAPCRAGRSRYILWGNLSQISISRSNNIFRQEKSRWVFWRSIYITENSIIHTNLLRRSSGNKILNSFLNLLIPFLIHRAHETAEIRKLERPLSGLVGYVVPHLARSYWKVRTLP